MASRASSSRNTAGSFLRALQRRFPSDSVFSQRQTRRPSLASPCYACIDGDRDWPGQRSAPSSAPHARRGAVSDDLFSVPPRPSEVVHSRCFAAQAGASSRVILAESDGHYSDVMEELKGQQKLAVIYFTAQWCGPCKQIAPYIDQLSMTFDDVAILKIDIDKAELAETMKEAYVGAVPTFHFYKGGNKVAELTGAARDKLDELVRSWRSEL